MANFPFQRKVLYVTAAAAPASGASPLTETVTFTVRNQSTVAKNPVTVAAPTVTASAGATATPTGCSPASLNLASGASGTVTCGYTLTAATGSASSFSFASTANGPSATAVGATAGPIAAGAATAGFAFDDLAAGPGDSVQATLKVTNNTSGPITVTPPTYAQLSVSSSLTRGTGTTDPVAEVIAAGATATFVYQFTVSGQVSDLYVVSGTAQTTAQPTNLATTPAGRVASTTVNITPEAIVQSRKAPGPYTFVVTVVNKSRLNVNRIDVVNPQNGTWTLLNDNGGSTFGATSVTGTRLANNPAAGTDTLRFSGTLTAGATATLNIRFTAIPVVTTTALYNFTVAVRNVNSLIQSFTETVADTFPIGDVTDLSVLSDASGQTLSWTNTSRADAPHDGVVVFKVAQPTVPASPADGTDYSIGSPAGVLYFDKDDSPIAGVFDSGAGAFNYRVCNHDANFVYSNCNSGFWNNAGWVDSVLAPANAWANALGGQMLLLPGVIPGGRIGVASNVPNVNFLDVATGQRALPAVALNRFPSAGTPVAPLRDGHQVLFAADQVGNVTAVDVQSGAITWQTSKSPATFVAGVNGALWQYAHPSFQALYSTDVLFLGSSQANGTVLAVNASTGATLWTVNAGSPVVADIYYDATRNWIYVPTNGGGIVPYDLGTSATQTTAPSQPASWVNPGGSFTLGCAYEDAASVTCVDTAGGVWVRNSSTGALVASGSSGITSPSTLWPVPGGLVVSNASSVKRLAISGTSVNGAATYTPGVTLSPVQVFVANGLVFVAGSDRKLHKLSLSTLVESGSVSIASEGSSTLLGPPAYDVLNDLFIFGDGNGRLWTVKSF